MAIQVQLDEVGSADELRVVPLSVPKPGAAEILIRQTAIGVNFIDIYHRRGIYPLPLPAVLGMEGAGIVEEIGPQVVGISPGDRVAYLDTKAGAYASHKLVTAERALPLPAGVPDEVAAVSMLRGLTAHMLLTRVHRACPGSVILVHAAAGGLGQLVSRWAKRLGATVIATVGSESKLPIAEATGADHVAVRGPNLTETVLQITGAQGADLVIDGLGGDWILRSLSCVRRFGTVACLGQAGGAIPDVPVEEIGRRSASLSCPSVVAYSSDLTSYRAGATALLAALAGGLPVQFGARYPLSDAAAAHRELESGASTGSLVLKP